jgi:hypothetical protein
VYTKGDVTGLADKVYDLIMGLRNGVGQDDLNNMVQAMMAAPAATNELKEDTDAAMLHIGARIMDRAGDDRVNPVNPS